MPIPKGATKREKAKYHSCVRKVTKNGGGRSPYAICQKAIFGRKKRK